MIITTKGYTLELNHADIVDIVEFALDSGHLTDIEDGDENKFIDTWLEGELKIIDCSISEGAISININKA